MVGRVAGRRRRTAPGASPSSTGTAARTGRRSGPSSSISVAASASALGVVEVGQARGRPLGDDAASRTARPPRTGRRPASRRSRSTTRGPPRLLADVVEQQPASPCRVASAGAAPRPRARPRRAAPCRPRSGRADAGSRRPSPRPGSRTPGPSGTSAPSSAVWSAQRSTTARTASGDIRASVRSWRGEKQMTRHVPALALGAEEAVLDRAVGRVGPKRGEVVGEHERVGVGRVPLAVRPDVARAQVAGRVVGQAMRGPAGVRAGPATAAGCARPRPAPTRRSAGCSADAAHPQVGRLRPVAVPVEPLGDRAVRHGDRAGPSSARRPPPGRARHRWTRVRVDDDESLHVAGDDVLGARVEAGVGDEDVRLVEPGDRADARRPPTSSGRRRPRAAAPASMSARSVSASSRLGDGEPGQLGPSRGRP